MPPRFVDRVVIHTRAGSGGNGCASVHREKFKPLGGPDGGNGGRGGSIVLVVDPQVHTLLDFHFHPHVDAASGKQGMGGNRAGAAGPDLEIKVPDGTVVLDEDGRMLADLDFHFSEQLPESVGLKIEDFDSDLARRSAVISAGAIGIRAAGSIMAMPPATGPRRRGLWGG